MAIPEALKTESFGILTQIEVDGVFKHKLDVPFRRYRILGACNPKLANRTLSANSGLSPDPFWNFALCRPAAPHHVIFPWADLGGIAQTAVGGIRTRQRAQGGIA